MFEALEDLSQTRTRRGCGLGRWMQTLEEDDRERLDNALRYSGAFAEEIIDLISPHYTVSLTTLRRHRRSIRGETSSAAGCGCQ